MKRRLFVLELKKNLMALPAFFGAMLFMSLVVSLLVFAGSSRLYKNGSPLSAKIAVVSYEADSSYVERLASYLGELSSASKGLEFEITDEERAREELRSGNVFAIMLIPDGMMEGILWGSNIPATIILPDEPDTASLIFAELTRAGADLLSAAQAGTYTASYLFSEAGENGKLGNAYDQIDLINFGYVLERENCFRRGLILPGYDELSYGGTSADPVLIYYICSGVLLFFFFSTVAFSQALGRDDPGFYNVYLSKGRLLFGSILIKTAAHFIVLFLSVLALYLLFFAGSRAAGKELLPSPSEVFVFLLLLSAVLSAFDVFWHMLADKKPGAVLMQLIFSLFMLFAGGTFLPKAFLPKALTGLGDKLPAAILHRDLLGIINGTETKDAAILLIYAGLITVLSALLAHIRSRGDRL
ncbi:MAG: ABC transporter permease [Lachnospiraceae bacterium]|nr:ABC transporter permease [Lachnospiraceae bacterium]